VLNIDIDDFLRNGFAIVDNVISLQSASALALALGRPQESDSVRNRNGVFAIRNLLEISPEVMDFAQSSAVRRLVEPILGPSFIAVRSILFDKIPGANWTVPWHQDLTIAVKERIEVEGFGPWSVKAGIQHVQPPAEVLEQMVSVRLHIDECSADNGALRVLPGTHLLGRIPKKVIPAVRKDVREQICPVPVGGAMLMRPLLLHASSPSLTPGHRRVIHIDYSAATLPGGLMWYEAQERETEPI